jgi:hypothetical protein
VTAVRSVLSRPVRRALLTGWFSFVHGEATAGDLLAADTVCGWLTDAGIPFDTAMSPVLQSGVPLDEIDPSAYSHLVFVCGPAAGWQVEELLDRFGHCLKVAVGVSVVGSTPPGFDVLLGRDGPSGERPDLSLGAALPRLPPRVGLVRAHRQGEYPDARHDEVHGVIDDTLRALDVTVVEQDTRVDPRGVTGRRTVDVEAALAGVDAVVTTRMHGLVLALRRGVPAVAVDVVPGGAKVSRQAAVLGWPAVLTVGDLTAERLSTHLTWALGAEAARLAEDCARRAAGALDEVRAELLGALVRTDTDGGVRPSCSSGPAGTAS